MPKWSRSTMSLVVVMLLAIGGGVGLVITLSQTTAADASVTQHPEELSEDQLTTSVTGERIAIPERLSAMEVPESDPVHSGKIIVELVDSAGRSVNAEGVQVRQGQLSRRVSSADDGSFVFDALPPGDWTVMVESPAETLAPYAQAHDAYPEMLPTRYRSPTVRLRAGACEPCRIVLLRPVQLQGRVVDGEGCGLLGAWVQVKSRNAGLRHDWVARTDEQGMFACEGLYPGPVFVRISGFDPGHRPPGATRPQRVRLELIEGQSAYVELVVGQGDLEISGTVLNGWSGAPLVGHSVQAWYCGQEPPLNNGQVPLSRADVAAEAVTDQDGVYRLRVFSDRAVSVSFSQGFPGRQPAQRPLCGWVDDLAYDPVRRRVGRLQQRVAQWVLDERSGLLAGRPAGATNWDSRWRQDIPVSAGSVVAPDIKVWPSRPYSLRGTVVWPGGTAASEVTVVVTQPESWTQPAEFDGLHMSAFRPRELHVQNDGSFSWSCEAPHGPVQLLITVPGLPAAEFSIVPEPGLTEELVFKLP